MHTNKLFSLYYIAGVPYLLPHGQLIADHYKGVKINETGEFIWNTLNGECRDFEELLAACALHYEAEGDEVDIIRRDILEFVNYLKSMNIVVGDSFDRTCTVQDKEVSQGSTVLPNSSASQTCTAVPNNTFSQAFTAVQDKIHSFLHNLHSVAVSEQISHRICIAGIKININAPVGTIAEEFSAFSSDEPVSSNGELNIYIHYTDDESAASSETEWFSKNLSEILAQAEPIIINYDLKIYDCGDYYYITCPASKKLEHIFMDKTGHSAHIFCKRPDEYDLTDGSEESLYTRLRKMKEARGVPVCELSGNDAPLPRLKDDIFHAVRLLFLYVAHNRDMLMLHSSSFLYKDKAWLFSASSGTGKSTHTNLWVKLFNTTLINGDLNLIAFEDGIPVVKGTPWCGTSGICDTGTHPLGGIILLKRSSTDFTEELPADEKRLYVLQRLISPAWNEKQIKKSINFLDKTVDNILVCRLNCTKEDSAAICMKERIDAFLSTK